MPWNIWVLKQQQALGCRTGRRISPSLFMWVALRELFSDSRILFGSDFPSAPDLLLQAETGDPSRLDTSANKFNALYYMNAKILFDLD